MAWNRTIRVALLEKTRIGCEGLSALIDGQAELEAVGAVTSLAELARVFRQYAPDVAVVDATIPCAKGDVVAEIAKLTRAHQQCRVVFLDDFPRQLRTRREVQLPTARYVVRDSGFAELIAAIRETAAGLGPKRTLPALGLPSLAGPTQSQLELPEERPLSVRETEILQLLAEGHSISECADILQVARSTADNHKTRLMKKLNLHKTAHLVRFAVREGLVQP